MVNGEWLKFASEGELLKIAKLLTSYS